jgi:hypothetical protein
MSKTTTATNYASETDKKIPLFNDLPRGPFVKSPDLDWPQLVATKTHCGAYCDYCRPKLTIMNAQNFSVWCASGEDVPALNLTRTNYTTSLPSKAVHLFRHPMDNLVARMHRGKIKRRQQGWREDKLSLFNDTRHGFLSWCSYIDARFQSFGRLYGLSRQQEQLAQSFPCYSVRKIPIAWYTYMYFQKARAPLTLGSGSLPIFS